MDGFFGIGIAELFMIAVIALIVLGPERLPGTIREVAKFIKQVRAIGGDLMSQFGDEFKDLADLDPRRILNEMTDPTKPEEPKKATPPKPTIPTPAKNTTANTTATNSVSTTTPTTKPATVSATTSTASTTTAIATTAAKNGDTPQSDEKKETATNGVAQAVAVKETPAQSKIEVSNTADITVPKETIEENRIAPPKLKPTTSATLKETAKEEVVESKPAKKATTRKKATESKLTESKSTDTATVSSTAAKQNKTETAITPGKELSEEKPKAKRTRKTKANTVEAASEESAS